MNKNNPKISVMMVSYNHEKYIAQALESVISQKTSYSFEIVISDDCSSDSTQEILRQYSEKYPSLIRCFYQNPNIGMAKNWLYCLSQCTGDYIALLEGDDYWVGDTKLQKQVEFLDSNQDYSICFNRVFEQIDTERQVSQLNPWEDLKSFTITELASGNFMHTNSVLFRNNNIVSRLPIWFTESPAVDFVIHMIKAKEGKIRYFPDVMGVYRRFTGIWSTEAEAVQIERVVKVLELLESEDFSSIVRDKLRIHKESLLSRYFSILFNNNDFSYLSKMERVLDGESELIRNWMLVEYPKRIQQIIDSKLYKIFEKINSFRKIIK